jgi:hypothetical protein
MWESIMLLIMGVAIICLAHQVGVKGNFKYTNFRDEWLKNLSFQELYNFKKGIGASLLLLGIVTIIIAVISNSIVVRICLTSLIFIIINIIRLGLKYIYLK